MKIKINIHFLGNHIFDKKPYRTKFMGTQAGKGQINIYSVNSEGYRKLLRWRKYEGYFGSKEDLFDLVLPSDHKEICVEFKALYGKFQAIATLNGEVIASID